MTNYASLLNLSCSKVNVQHKVYNYFALPKPGLISINSSKNCDTLNIFSHFKKEPIFKFNVSY